MDVKSQLREQRLLPNPIGWKPERIGLLGDWLSGGTPSMSDPTLWNGAVPWVSAKEMKASRFQNTSAHVSAKAIGQGTRLAPKGSLLIVVRGMILAHTLPVAVLEIPMAFNQDIKCLRPRPDVDIEYVLYWFQLNANRVLSNTSESTHGTKRLASDDLFSIELMLPGRAEQRAIAEALGDVDALIGALEKLIAKKRDIKQAAMQQLLTGRTRLPGFVGDWRTKRLAEMGTFSKGQGIRKDQVLSDGIPCIRYGEIYTRHNDFIRQFYSFVSPTVAKTSRRLRKGDLLFAGSGETAEEIGKCVAFLGDEVAFAGGDIVVLSPIDQDSKFLGYLMNHSTVVEQKAQMGQGDAVVHISARNLGQVVAYVPELREQTAIASVLSDMDDEIATLQARLAKTRDIKQGMMQELLTGRTRLV